MSRTVIAALALLFALPVAVAGPVKAQKKRVPLMTAPAPVDPPRRVINDAPSSAETLAHLKTSDREWGHYAVLTAFELEATWRENPPSDQTKPLLTRAISLLATATAMPSMVNDVRMDEAVFRLSALYQASGRTVFAMQTFKRLIKDFPLSRFVPDAYLSFADVYFEKNDMDLARKFYQKVAEYPKAHTYAYALYKIGWVDFNLGDAARALQDFVATLAATTDAKQVTLHRAALADLVMVYAKVGAPDQAYAFFRKIAPGDVRDLLVRLAHVLDDDGNAQAAGIVREAIAGLGGQGKASVPAP